ncbi:zinc finger MYM-type protein 1-like [Macrobrachium nipponense]|uniref:zinc finger MYM-type protein 1-like n=1 Tax=Macrobrachium nipponense TaxID=159736 RepID=UPI0030C8CDE7
MLQSKAVDLAEAADLLKVCMVEMCRLRNQFEDVKKEATDTAQKWSIRPEFEKKRLRTVKGHFGELCEDQRLEDPESLCRVTVYYRTLDIITTQLNFRFTGLHEVVSSCSVLEPISLQNLTDSELYGKASSFVEKYHNDVSETFTQEILSMRSALKGEISKVSSIKDLGNMLIIENHSISASFPEVCTAMLMFLTIPVTTASAERSFSTLKLVKNYLRSTMAQERVEGLALLSVEQGTAQRLNLSKVIDRYTEMKARKKEF